MALLPGSVFAGYVIERLLGTGGMGEVYVARHPRLPRSDALKILSSDLSADAQFRRRFEQEADVVAGLRHRGIVTVHDRGEFDGRLWIALELIEGFDARSAAGPAGMPARDVAAIIGPVAEALDYAGARGLVHRDVKPANILVGTDRRVVLTDFGIVRMQEAGGRLTSTGLMIGTAQYMSPEQAQGHPVDPRSDQYSLAVTAFDLLAGNPPFASSNVGAVIIAHVTRPVPSVRTTRPDLHPGVDGVLQRALAKSPADRYPSCVAFASALAAALSERPDARAAGVSVPAHTAVAPAPVRAPLAPTFVATRPVTGMHPAPITGRFIPAPPHPYPTNGVPPGGPAGPTRGEATRRRWALRIALASAPLLLLAALLSITEVSSGVALAISYIASGAYFVATLLNVRFGRRARTVGVVCVWVASFMVPIGITAVVFEVTSGFLPGLMAMMLSNACQPGFMSAAWLVGSARQKLLFALPLVALVATPALVGLVITSVGRGGMIIGSAVVGISVPVAVLITVLAARVAEARESPDR
ncbi:serine/threonine-protein kinase, partial [Tsukamurella paurometabola]